MNEAEGLVAASSEGRSQPVRTFRETALQAIRAAAFLALHTALALVLICAITGVHIFLHWVGEPKLFDWIPLRYLFDVLDLGVIVFFIVGGVSDARSAFRD